MRLRSLWHFNRLTFFLVDYFALWLAVVGAFKLSPRYVNDILEGFWLNDEVTFIGYGMPLFMALGLLVTGSQRSQSGFHASIVIAQTFGGIAGGMLVFVTLHALVKFSLIGRFVLAISLVYGTAFIVGVRLIVGKLAEQQKRRVLVYGTAQAKAILTGVLAEARLPIEVIGHTNLNTPLRPARSGEAVRFNDEPLSLICERAGVEEVIVEFSHALTPGEREALLRCTGLGIRVIEMGHFFERELEKVYVLGLNEAWFWGYDPADSHPVYFALKRSLDVVISLVGLAAVLPFAPIIILLIKLDDGGPVFYSQTRIGLRNHRFLIFKFRTMRMDAEQGGARWAKKNDDRVTRFGRFMRSTRIDEVPQFINILTGEMSFIGPRPERPEFIEVIEKQLPFYRYRHLVKPGLTGWAQVNYPYGASVEDARQKLAYDLYYMKYWTVTRELHIILRTIVAMIRGAR